MKEYQDLFIAHKKEKQNVNTLKRGYTMRVELLEKKHRNS
jgi:hypothetical protein